MRLTIPDAVIANTPKGEWDAFADCFLGVDEMPWRIQDLEGSCAVRLEWQSPTDPTARAQITSGIAPIIERIRSYRSGTN